MAGDGSSETGPGDSGPPPIVVYANTDVVLFEVDPSTLLEMRIGAFDCVGGTGQDPAVTDVAVDHDGVVWAITAHELHQITRLGGAAHCATSTALAGTAGATFYGLSFAPAGTLDPSNEVLVAADTAGELWTIDATGALAQHGTLGTVPADDGQGHTYANAGKPWELSGDLVIVSNGGSPVGYATVRDCPNPPSATGCNPVDTLVGLDLTQLGQAGTQVVVSSVIGQIVKAAGCSDSAHTGYGSLLGIATSGAGEVLGFSHLGYTVKISETDGSGCIGPTPTTIWGGAGTSSLAAQ